MHSRRILTAISALLLAASCGDNKSNNGTPGDVDDDLPLPLADGPSPTPPMGWNSWNKFGGGVSETIIKGVTDAMVASGMKDAGYQYVNIDDGWSLPDRAADGSLQPGPNFPNGIPPIADYVHQAGLKLGIYGDRGTLTCGGKAGSLGHEMQDAMTFASWGIEYIKWDNCSADAGTIETDYQTMGAAITAAGQAAGRPMLYSVCAWNFYQWEVGLGNLWRTTTDITPKWDQIYANFMTNRSLAAYAGPNNWNDPDMLEVGNGLLTDTENQSHFSLWAIGAAPLIAGDDPRHLTASEQAILTNAEVIALDQDPMGLQGAPVFVDDFNKLAVFAKPLNASGARAVVLLNGSDAPADLSVTWSQIGLRAGTAATVRDLWQHADLGSFTDSYTAAQVPSHGVAALKLMGSEPARPSGALVYLSDLQWTYAANGVGQVAVDQSSDASPISLAGTAYPKGLGVVGPSLEIFRLANACKTFTATVGVDDSTAGQGSVVFQVWADRDPTPLFDSGTMTGSSAPQAVSVSVVGKRRLRLLVTNAGDGASYDRGDWADAKLDCSP
jgi:alpha-galactosidase